MRSEDPDDGFYSDEEYDGTDGGVQEEQPGGTGEAAEMSQLYQLGAQSIQPIVN